MRSSSMTGTIVMMATATMATALACGCAIEGPRDESVVAGSFNTDRPDDAIPEAIIGGSEASAYPEAALVNMYSNGYQTSSCSGSVIAPRIVLTAGHCVVGGHDSWKVLAPYAKGGQSAYSHKALTYDWTDNGNTVNPNQHDIGLLVLDSDILLDVYPLIATAAISPGTKVINIGRIDNGKMSSTKLFVSKPISVSNGSGYGYPYDYAASEIIQSGDSGGPDLLAGPAPRSIVAVNSGAGGGIELLARVDLLSGWIQQQIDSYGNAAPPAPPPPPDPPPPPPTCAHDICSNGGALADGCDACVTQICAQDSYCCSNGWDDQCVAEVGSICGQSCDEPPAPPPPPPPPPPPEDPCGGISYEGQCEGALLSWCEGEQLHQVQCDQNGKQCGWDANNNFYNCI